ncbi:MAG: hypothetical protein GEU90_00935 [Gemmatimonas sp.]|nr:hypothetical protein [Gemmatimonas sp.]
MSRRRKSPSRDPRSIRNSWGSVYPTLDLHGRTAPEAEREAELWLIDQRFEGETMVRLVTGRGLHSVGSPILPGAIEGLLSRLRGSVVQTYEPEPGGGAYRIRLTKGERRKAPADRTIPEAEPGVLREAAEKLADLGIAPTPALLEAEVRRIIKGRSGETE